MCGPNAVSPIRNLATGIFFRCWFLEDHPYHPKKLALKNLATKLMPTATSGIHITQEIGHKRLRLWVSGGQRWWQTGCQTTQSPCRPGWIVRQWLCLQYQSCRIYRCSPCTRSHSSHGSDPLQMQPETTTKATKNFTIFCHWKIISSLPCILGSKSKVIGDPTPYTQVTIFIPQYKNEKMEKKKQTSNLIPGHHALAPIEETASQHTPNAAEAVHWRGIHRIIDLQLLQQHWRSCLTEAWCENVDWNLSSILWMLEN